MSRRAFLPIFAASGAAALVYEVTWTRLLTLELGHGVAAASTVLAAFMGGLAVGSALGGRIGSRLSPARALTAYAGLELTIAVLAAATGIGAVYFAESLDSILMCAGLLSFVIALFWLLQAGILVKNVYRASRRNARMAQAVSSGATPVTLPPVTTPVEPDEPPAAEIITIRDSEELVASE